MNSQVSKSVTTQNILLSALIVINLMLVFVVTYFFLSDDKSSESVSSAKTITQKIDKAPASNPVVAYSAETAKQIAEVVRGTDKSKLKDVDNNDIHGDKRDAASKASQQVNISKIIETSNQTFDELDALSSKDASYVEALDELRKEQSSRINMKETAITELTVGKVKQSNAEQSIDYFNKVDVSKINIQLAIASDKLRLKAQIAQIVAEPEGADLDQNTLVAKPDEGYLAALKTESIERANEMRTVKVVKGDSLWEIAVRAYGDGYQYPRIFAANPNLTDPDKIEVGAFLRVPL